MTTPRNPQDEAFPSDFDYVEGSPHLKHRELRLRVQECLHALVGQQISQTGTCRVLEVGAGHGEFTDVLLSAGARVTVTEMSQASAHRIERKYAVEPRVDVVHDADALWMVTTTEQFDLVACISVLHHIPDYESFMSTVARVTHVGGSFVSWQDPTWYPRRDALTHRAEQASYYLWRIRQGDLRRGLATRVRRIRGRYDETNAADMSEYHVVRSGVDEEALQVAAREFFDETELFYYWSTQSTAGQRAGEWIAQRRELPNTFGLIARGRR